MKLEESLKNLNQPALATTTGQAEPEASAPHMRHPPQEGNVRQLARIWGRDEAVLVAILRHIVPFVIAASSVAN